MRYDISLPLEKAKQYILEKKYSSAIIELKKEIISEPKNPEAHFELGKIYYIQKHISDAIRELESAIQLNSTNVHAHFLLAKAFRSKREFDAAIREYESALELGQGGAEMYRELGFTYNDKKDFERSSENFKKAIEIEPGDCGTLELLARAYLRIKKFNLAIGEFKKALKIDPSSQCRRELGNAYEEIGEYDLALECYKKLGSDSDSQKRIKEMAAASYYKKIGNKIAKQKRFNTGLISLSCGERYAKKIKELENACKMDKENVDNYIRLARLYKVAGKRERAVAMLKMRMNMVRNKSNKMLKNKMLNEIEIIQGRLILKSKPRFLHVTITNKCNIDCIMCIAPKTPVWDISPKIVKEVIRCMPYLQEIYWQGGEIFLSKYFKELFDRANEHNIIQQVVTNGQLINEEWASKFGGNKVMLSLSIDGVTRKTYEEIRKGASFEKLIRNIELVNKYRNKNTGEDADKAKSWLTLNYVVMKRNYNEIDKVPDFAHKYGFDSITFAAIEKTVSEENVFFHKDIKILNIIEKKIKQAQQKAMEYNICVTSTIAPIQAFDDKKNKNGKAEIKESNIVLSSGLCYAPWQCLYVESSIIRPRCCCEESMSEQNSLEKAWNCKGMQSYRKKIIDNKFDWCDYKCILGTLPEQFFKYI
jgi:tetratricopeptide (TPR) repeat protein